MFLGKVLGSKSICAINQIYFFIMEAALIKLFLSQRLCYYLNSSHKDIATFYRLLLFCKHFLNLSDFI